MARVLICAHTYFDREGTSCALIPISQEYAKLLLQRIEQVTRLGEFGLDPLLQFSASEQYGDAEDWQWMYDIDVDDFEELGAVMGTTNEQAYDSINEWLGFCRPSVLPDTLMTVADDEDYPFNTVYASHFRVDNQVVRVSQYGVRFAASVYPVMTEVCTGELAKEVIEEIAKNPMYTAFPAPVPTYRQ